jgi:hypothetical protein
MMLSYGDHRCLRFMTLTFAGLPVANIHCFRFLAFLGSASFAKKSSHLIFSIASVTINPSLKSLTCAGVAVLRPSILNVSAGMRACRDIVKSRVWEEGASSVNNG